MINRKVSKKVSNPVKGVDDEMTEVMDNPYLCANTFMYPGYGMVSTNGAVTAVYQFDGDLCTYGPEWTWCAGAGSLVDSSGAGYAKLNLDGNFVLKSYDHVSYWSTGTQGNQDAYLTIQNDGNLCINSLDLGTGIWCSNEDNGMTDDADVDDDYYLNNFNVEGCSLTDDYGSFVNDDDVRTRVFLLLLYFLLLSSTSLSIFPLNSSTLTLTLIGPALFCPSWQAILVHCCHHHSFCCWWSPRGPWNVSASVLFCPTSSRLRCFS